MLRFWLAIIFLTRPLFFQTLLLVGSRGSLLISFQALYNNSMKVVFFGTENWNLYLKLPYYQENLNLSAPFLEGQHFKT